MKLNQFDVIGFIIAVVNTMFSTKVQLHQANIRNNGNEKFELSLNLPNLISQETFIGVNFRSVFLFF